MANNCFYELHIKGSAEAIDEMERRLTDYDHRPHFGRVFSAERTEIGEGVARFNGSCAWSVNFCLVDPLESEDDPTEITSLAKTAAELHAEIEVFSEVENGESMEHYRYSADGTAIAEESVDCYEVCWDRDEYPTFAEFAKNEETYGLSEKDFGDEEYVTIGELEWKFSI